MADRTRPVNSQRALQAWCEVGMVIESGAAAARIIQIVFGSLWALRRRRVGRPALDIGSFGSPTLKMDRLEPRAHPPR
jgi:hypothetical protein